MQQCQRRRTTARTGSPQSLHPIAQGVPRSVNFFLRSSVFFAACCAFVAAVFAALSCLFATAMLSSAGNRRSSHMRARDQHSDALRGGDSGTSTIAERTHRAFVFSSLSSTCASTAASSPYHHVAHHASPVHATPTLSPGARLLHLSHSCNGTDNSRGQTLPCSPRADDGSTTTAPRTQASVHLCSDTDTAVEAISAAVATHYRSDKQSSTTTHVSAHRTRRGEAHRLINPSISTVFCRVKGAPARLSTALGTSRDRGLQRNWRRWLRLRRRR